MGHSFVWRLRHAGCALFLYESFEGIHTSYLACGPQIWYNVPMTKEQLLRRKRAVAAALGSVRAEGLEPSKETVEQLSQFADGRADIDVILRQTIQDVTRKPKV